MVFVFYRLCLIVWEYYSSISALKACHLEFHAVDICGGSFLYFLILIISLWVSNHVSLNK